MAIEARDESRGRSICIDKFSVCCPCGQVTYPDIFGPDAGLEDEGGGGTRGHRSRRSAIYERQLNSWPWPVQKLLTSVGFSVRTTMVRDKRPRILMLSSVCYVMPTGERSKVAFVRLHGGRFRGGNGTNGKLTD